MNLWCDQCHTCWTEVCLHQWQKCPFVDCKGTLTLQPPASLVHRSRARRQKPEGYPLLDAAEERSA
jgi:hypothetical protein